MELIGSLASEGARVVQIAGLQMNRREVAEEHCPLLYRLPRKPIERVSQYGSRVLETAGAQFYVASESFEPYCIIVIEPRQSFA